ncbi:MAG TPA: phosphoribosylformylglycinamidine cyclo-ligase, partial [Actinomycetota bacterium]|nr:phosphoribosylformylglycinamidine cyclo-ligase [Actinomycetota bacterium]
IASSYRAAGVDLEGANRLKRRLAALVDSTRGPEVLGELGGFGGCYQIGELPEPDPVLVSSADGVGTKVLVAHWAGRHDTIGEDLVNHCVNDLLAAGARPLFFLDYIAAGKLESDIVLALVAGLARACRANRAALIGGETAEMPDLYAAGHYDLAGFIVGVAPRARLGWRAEKGDVVLGLPSSGLHTNGYTLARRLVIDRGGHLPDEEVPWGGETWADILLAVHKSYLEAVEPLVDDPDLHAVAHVTGGGFAGNLPRVLPQGLAAQLERDAWTVPPLFGYLAQAGEIDEEEMYRVFNMGIGLCLVVARDSAARVAECCAQAGEQAIEIGRVVEGEGVEWR